MENQTNQSIDVSEIMEQIRTEIKEKGWRNVFMLPPVPPMPKLLRSPQSNSEI